MAVPFITLLAEVGGAAAPIGNSPVKVDTEGPVAKIKFEAPLAGFLADLNGKYKLQVTNYSKILADTSVNTTISALESVR